MLEKVGKYKIVNKIGQGAMGEVFRAHDPVLNRDVAIKTISAELTGDEELQKRFLREARAAAVLNHPNIITVFDFGQEGDKLYMAMELLEGIDVKQAIVQKGLPDLNGRVAIMEQVAEGLAFAHSKQIVHRDLKPANIHLQHGTQVKVVDFGLARLSGSEMTRTGMVMGTPHYMSPEQVRGEKADTRSDIFALGCVFYEILCGRKPFDADSMHAVLFKVMQEDPPALQEVAPSTPLCLVQVVEGCLDKDPSRRYQDAGELRRALGIARQAMAAGQGNEVLPDLIPGALAAEGATGSPRVAGSGSVPRGERSRVGSSTSRGSGSRPTPAPTPAAPPPAPSRVPLFAGLGLGVGALVMAGAFFFRGQAAPPSPPPTTQAHIDPLTQELAASKVELAQKRMDAGDYVDAARQAEGALRLDPTNAEAHQSLDRARKIEATVAAAVEDLKTPAKAADALWMLLGVDPDHAAVAGALAAQEGAFKAHVDEARKMMADSRAAAEKAQATGVDAFKEGDTLVKAAEEAAKAGQNATASARFLLARDRFQRAARRAAR